MPSFPRSRSNSLTELQLADVVAAAVGERNDDNIRLLNDNILLIGDRNDGVCAAGELSSPPPPKLADLLGTSIETLTGFFFLRPSIADEEEEEEEEEASASHSEHKPVELGSSGRGSCSPISTRISGSAPGSTGDLHRGQVE